MQTKLKKGKIGKISENICCFIFAHKQFKNRFFSLAALKSPRAFSKPWLFKELGSV